MLLDLLSIILWCMDPRTSRWHSSCFYL